MSPHQVLGEALELGGREVCSSFSLELDQEVLRIADGSADADLADGRTLTNNSTHSRDNHAVNYTQTGSPAIEEIDLADLPLYALSKISMNPCSSSGPSVSADTLWQHANDTEAVLAQHIPTVGQIASQSIAHSPITSEQRIAELSDTSAVPDIKHAKVIGDIRHTHLTVYKRLHLTVLVANMAGLIYYLVKNSCDAARMESTTVAAIAASNICLCILARQDYIVNALFKTCWHIPHSAPLRLRRIMAKVYENGGVHSGAAISGVVWFMLLVVLITIDQGQGRVNAIPEVVLGYVAMVIFLAICVCAMPFVRNSKHHNIFQYSHRFGGWAALIIFWIAFLLLVGNMARALSVDYCKMLKKQATFYILLIITVHICLPWLNLRKWRFEAVVLSGNALHLRWKKALPPLSGIAIAEHPFGEYHSFATFPNWLPDREGNTSGGSMLISCVGDWTGRNVVVPQDHYWVKGMPKTGVLSMGFIFRRIVVVTTGAGLGPCLSFLLEPSRKTECKVLWCTQNPLVSYGREWVEAVHRADPNAIIIDSKVRRGRADMTTIAYNLYRESNAEAVFVISNAKLTKSIVFALESRGIPAFGPIWDS